jgi:hypothetical protein
MKFLKFLGAIVWNLIVVVVAGAVLGDLEYQGGSQEIAALAFIILGAVQIGFAVQARTNATFTIANQKQNSLILRALGKEEDANFLDEDCKVAIEALKETGYKFWINAIGVSIIWLIASLILLGNL